ncbi:MAG: hypothetical protein LBC42_01490, partial [Puniceicoccales bacterium]|nr:hypothetical protein [Puniceicoccales bacterium]
MNRRFFQLKAYCKTFAALLFTLSGVSAFAEILDIAMTTPAEVGVHESLKWAKRGDTLFFDAGQWNFNGGISVDLPMLNLQGARLGPDGQPVTFLRQFAKNESRIFTASTSIDCVQNLVLSGGCIIGNGTGNCSDDGGAIVAQDSINSIAHRSFRGNEASRYGGAV